MDYWKFYNNDWDDFDIYDKVGYSDQELYMDLDIDLDVEDHIMNKQLEKESFENKPGHGKFAPAYSHDIDNIRIIQMRESACTLREIAKEFSCSPSTIRNRLRKMGMR